MKLAVTTPLSAINLGHVVFAIAYALTYYLIAWWCSAHNSRTFFHGALAVLAAIFVGELVMDVFNAWRRLRAEAAREWVNACHDLS